MIAPKALALAIALTSPAFLTGKSALSSEDLLTIAFNGKTSYVIVCANQPTELEKKAVQELGVFLSRATGVSFPSVSESAMQGAAKGIYVGWTDFAAQSGIDAARLGEEEWVIRSEGENLNSTELSLPFLPPGWHHFGTPRVYSPCQQWP